MKNKKMFVIIAAVLVLLLVAAAVAYPKLAENISPTVPTDAVTDPVTGADGSTEDYPADPAADFTVYDASGAAVKLSELKGRPVIVNFWATWCPPCRAELPFFEEAYRQYGEKVAFMMVDLADGSQETQSGAESFVSENGYTFPVYFDLAGEASAAYRLYSIPQTVAVDAKGNVVFSQIGSLPRDTVLELAASLAGE